MPPKKGPLWQHRVPGISSMSNGWLMRGRQKWRWRWTMSQDPLTSLSPQLCRAFTREELLMELLTAEHSEEEPDDGELEGSSDNFIEALKVLMINRTLNKRLRENTVPNCLNPPDFTVNYQQQANIGVNTVHTLNTPSNESVHLWQKSASHAVFSCEREKWQFVNRQYPVEVSKIIPNGEMIGNQSCTCRCQWVRSRDRTPLGLTPTRRLRDMMDAANRRLSLPLSLFSAGPPGRIVLSHTNGASASDEPRRKLRKLPLGSENLNPSTPAAASSRAHARCSSAFSALMTPTIKQVVAWFGTRQPKNEDRDDNEIVNLVREEAEEENNMVHLSQNERQCAVYPSVSDLVWHGALMVTLNNAMPLGYNTKYGLPNQDYSFGQPVQWNNGPSRVFHIPDGGLWNIPLSQLGIGPKAIPDDIYSIRHYSMMDTVFKESVPRGIGCIPGTENQCHGFIVDTGDQGGGHIGASAFRGLSPPRADIDLAERGLDFLNIQIQREGWGGGTHETGSDSTSWMPTLPKKPANHTRRLMSHQEPLHGIMAARPGRAWTRETRRTGGHGDIDLVERGFGLGEHSDLGRGPMRRRKLAPGLPPHEMPRLSYLASSLHLVPSHPALSREPQEDMFRDRMAT
ncbi:hypothetical protein B0H14DRAFT_3125529 [Mycena olivaceomarginata]|nr:hypothetical protein B0H14DRAFT_3125529 [Mycena olivaceomarginata]